MLKKIILMLLVLMYAPLIGHASTLTQTIRVEALIDGRSQLILRGDTAQWFNLDYAAPGRHEFRNEPTIINGVEWYPVWPDYPDAENRSCHCYSDIFYGVEPPLPQSDMTVTLNIIRSRYDTHIAQYPDAGNNYALIIEFNDNPPGGSDIYINDVVIELEIKVLDVPVDIKPQSCPNPLNFGSKGVIPAAILGTNTFEVTKVDPASIRLEGVAPLRSSLEDVATPYVPFVGKSNSSDCTDKGSDGLLDITLKFDSQEIYSMIESTLGREVNDGETLILPLTGNLREEFGGTPIKGEDVVVIKKKGQK